MRADRAAAARQGRCSGPQRCRRPAVHGRDPLAGTGRFALARPATGAGTLAGGPHLVPAVDRAEAWERLFKALGAGPASEWVLIEATISKVHADATSQKGA